MKRESQRSITEWGNIIFSPNKKVRGRALLEETIELVLETGLDLEEIRTLVDLVYLKTKPKKTKKAIEEEAADVGISLFYLASSHKFDLSRAINKKMDLNRRRPKSYYMKKLREKRKLGLR